MKNLIFAGIFALSFNAVAKTEKATAKPAAEVSSGKVYFTNLKDGQTIPTEYKVKFTVEGMDLKKAGTDVDDKKAGHHHILVNQGPTPEGQVIPNDAEHLHFGQAQTEGVLKLKPGTYTLTLQLADGAHRSYGERLSSSVKVIVK